MSGAIARKPRPANTGSWLRQESESSGQPWTKMTGTPFLGPASRKYVVWRSLRQVRSATVVVMGLPRITKTRLEKRRLQSVMGMIHCGIKRRKCAAGSETHETHQAYWRRLRAGADHGNRMHDGQRAVRRSGSCAQSAECARLLHRAAGSELCVEGGKDFHRPRLSR